MDMMAPFQAFFECCIGSWETERTYHYLKHQEVERSHTEFEVVPLDSVIKTKVLSDNQYEVPLELETLPGFQLSFSTLSEKGEAVSQTLNMLFVPKQMEEGLLVGDYLRDKAYEEAKPMISQFRFNPETNGLLMTTKYTRVVSVDSIQFINPGLRIRKIFNYQRPEAGQPLDTMLLVGFGVEQKVS